MPQSQTPRHDGSHPNAVREPSPLPHGVELRPLTVYTDDRGRVAEIFRNEWLNGPVPVQWAMAISDAGVVRGVHVHLRHDDYFVLLQGHSALGLHDLRPGSPTAGCATMLDLRGDELAAVIIPHGVAHGFLFLSASTYIIGASHYYDRTDELGCHWLDPALRLGWPLSSARLSARDAALPPLAEVARLVGPWRAG